MSRADARLLPTRDHVIPVCRGGKVKIICCQTCNGIKADMLPDVWNAFMDENPRWWALSRADLRAIKRKARGLVPRHRARRMRYLQGTAPAPPVVVPPQLVYG